MLDKFNRYLVFTGKRKYHEKVGMEGVVCSTPDVGDAFKYILKNNLANEENWYQVFDCTTCQMVLDTLSENLEENATDEFTDENHVGALSKRVNDAEFEYKFKVDDVITYELPENSEFECNGVTALVKYVSNKNKRQLLVCDAGKELGKVELAVSEDYKVTPATDLDLLELMQ